MVAKLLKLHVFAQLFNSFRRSILALCFRLNGVNQVPIFSLVVTTAVQSFGMPRQVRS